MADIFLSNLAQRVPSQAALLSEISDLFSKKLWYNITDKVEEFVRTKDLSSDLSMEFYEKFLKEFELNMNLLRLAQIVVIISSKLTDGARAIQFLESVYTKVETKKNNEALVILLVQIALWQLKTGDSVACKKTLDKARDLIDKTGYVDNVVNASYYRAISDYFMAVDEPNEFYKNALLFLAYTPIENIEFVSQQALAFDLGIAALLGDHIYNFGELLSHPVIESLNGSQAEWLVKLLFAFNRGSIQEYQRVNQTYQSQIDSSPVLQQRKTFLQEKMQLMAIMELVFSRPANNRTIPFVDVQQATGANNLDLVEPMLLKALAYDLIRGKIDGVGQTISVTWAQPRVLDKSQISNLQVKVSSWLDKVNQTLTFLEEQGSDEFIVAN